MEIDRKSTATLIDELFTTLLKCWHYQEIVMNSEDVGQVAWAGKEAQKANARRNQLIRTIDERMGEGEITALSKSYDHEEIRRRFEKANAESSTMG